MRTLGKIQKAVLRQEISHRGGGIEISLDSFGFKGEKMAAYQNYLGGGMLGRIMTNNTLMAKRAVLSEKQVKKLDKIALELAQYFHSLTNHDGDEWEDFTFEQNQKMPSSAY